MPCALRRALPAAILLLLLSLLPTGCGSKAANEEKVRDTLAEAAHEVQVNADDKQARKMTDRAIALAPNDPDTYFGDPNAPFPPIPPTENGVAAVFAAVGDDAALADYMQQAVAKFPNDERGYQILADAQGRLGRTAEQKATAAKLVTVLAKKLQTPGATDILGLTTALAQAYFDSGDPVNGAATYHKAIQAYPTDPTPPNNLAYAYAVAGTNLPEALQLSQKALALAAKKNDDDQTMATYQDTLGWVEYRLGRFQEAEPNLQEAADALPRLPEIRFHLGSVYAAEGKTDAARTEFAHALLLSPGYAAARQSLAQLPKAGAAVP